MIDFSQNTWGLGKWVIRGQKIKQQQRRQYRLKKDRSNKTNNANKQEESWDNKHTISKPSETINRITKCKQNIPSKNIENKTQNIDRIQHEVSC